MTKIMLVEDDNNLREIYEARLAAEGYEIVSAQDGEAALAMASKEHPDMIISDIMMPKISGFEMLDILRNTDSLKNVKIIMLTALGQIEDSARANSLGADRYLVKSQVTLEDIVKATHDLLDDPSTTAAPAVAEPVPEAAPGGGLAAPDPKTSPGSALAVEAAGITEPEAVAEAPALVAAPAAEPETAIQSAPEVAVEPAQENPTEPAALPEPTPPPVRTIPVQDFAAAEPEPAQNLHPISNLPVSPEPSNEPAAEPDDSAPDLAQSIVPAPVSDDAQDDSTASSDDDSDDSSANNGSGAAEDFTSPGSFNKFQAPPTVPAETPDTPISAEPQTSAAEEFSIKARIDDFINRTSASDDGPATAQQTLDTQEPVAEELDTMPAPVISASDEADIPAPTPVAVTAPTLQPVAEPAPEPAPESVPESAADDNRDTMMSSAASQLEISNAPAASTDQDNPASSDTAAQTPAAPSTGTKLRTISPLDSEPKKSLDQLLELEDAKASAQQAAANQAPAPPLAQNRPNINAYNPSSQMTPPPQPRPPVDPNSISL